MCAPLSVNNVNLNKMENQSETPLFFVDQSEIEGLADFLKGFSDAVLSGRVQRPNDSKTYRTKFRDKVRSVINEVEEMLVNKNKAYGNAALEPLRIFSKADSTDGILLRIDDKLNRIKNVGITPETEDSVMDLIGYLVLLKISQKENGKKQDIIEKSNSISVADKEERALSDHSGAGSKQNTSSTSEVPFSYTSGSPESGKPF